MLGEDPFRKRLTSFRVGLPRTVCSFGNDFMGVTKTQTPKTQTSDLRPRKLRPRKLRPRKLRPRKLRPRKLRPRKLRPRKLRPRKLRPRKLRPREIKKKNRFKFAWTAPVDRCLVDQTMKIKYSDLVWFIYRCRVGQTVNNKVWRDTAADTVLQKKWRFHRNLLFDFMYVAWLSARNPQKSQNLKKKFNKI